MKTFFNVLYRRILYKIPLKFLLILLAVVAVFMACFSHAQFTGDCVKTDIKTKVDLIGNYTKTTPSWYVGDMFKAWLSLSAGQTIHNTDIVDHGNYVCFTSAGSDQYNYCNNLEIIYNNTTYLIDSRSELVCFYVQGEFDFHNPESYTCEWFAIVPNWYSDIITTQYTSQECQTEYNLIPISSVDQSYCVNNNLCPASGSPSDCPNVGVSNLFINDIFHPGAFNIIINIPEEIDWDYAYTNSGSNINIDVVGYNVDYTKVQDQIDIQNFKPSDEDLSNIVSQVLPLFVPGLAIILLLYFIFRFIKKIF